MVTISMIGRSLAVLDTEGTVVVVVVVVCVRVCVCVSTVTNTGQYCGFIPQRGL